MHSDRTPPGSPPGPAREESSSMKPASLCLILTAAIAQATSLKPADLRTEYRKDPLGIDELQPRLSWKLVALDPAARNLRQSAYRIILSP
jgi:hypothetical protein